VRTSCARGTEETIAGRGFAVTAIVPNIALRLEQQFTNTVIGRLFQIAHIDTFCLAQGRRDYGRTLVVTRRDLGRPVAAEFVIDASEAALPNQATAIYIPRKIITPKISDHA